MPTIRYRIVFQTIRVLEIRASEIRTVEIRASEIRVLEIRAVEIRVSEIRVLEIRAVEIRVSEIRAVEIRASEIRVLEIRAVEIRASEIRVLEIRVLEIRALEIRASEIRVSEIRAPEIRAVEIRASEIRALEIRACRIHTRRQPRIDQPTHEFRPRRCRPNLMKQRPFDFQRFTQLFSIGSANFVLHFLDQIKQCKPFAACTPFFQVFSIQSQRQHFASNVSAIDRSIADGSHEQPSMPVTSPSEASNFAPSDSSSSAIALAPALP